jgi:hypothetical protein
MKNDETVHSDIYQEFDSNYIVFQLLNFKKWIILSTIFSLTIGAIYCLSAEKLWLSEVQIGQANQQDIKELYLLQRIVPKVIYGYSQLDGERILNEFVSFSNGVSKNIQFRKDVEGTFLIQSTAATGALADQQLDDFLKVQNDLFFKEYLKKTFLNIETQISDELTLTRSQRRIQLQLYASLIINYMTRLNELKYALNFYYKDNLLIMDIDKSMETLVANDGRLLLDNYAFFNNKEKQDLDAKLLNEMIGSIRGLMKRPMKPIAYHIKVHKKAAESAHSPNAPVILILSAVFGFMISIFGILLYVSGAPIIRKSESND